ncbi:hypothetical protein [Oryza sativa Japonica Group]|uniref:Uncharacterized protein n=1 Tax=Oryza sativa subsp. japonica TaxID=39947 RepID=Q5JMU9_ORYSJ|nr:hypothetical protein [Oryza sativa Japonica Group]
MSTREVASASKGAAGGGGCIQIPKAKTKGKRGEEPKKWVLASGGPSFSFPFAVTTRAVQAGSYS